MGMVLRLYPGSRPDEHQTGTAETFDEARTSFEAACEAPAERSLEIPYFEDLALFRVIPLHGSVPGSVASRSLWVLNTTIWGQILKKNVRHSGKAQV